MGGCASVSKAMRAESTKVPPPEQPKEETAATPVAEETASTTVAEETAAAAVTEEAKAEGGVDANRKEKAVEVDASNEIEEIEEEQTKIEASILVSEVKKEKKSDMAEQK